MVIPASIDPFFFKISHEEEEEEAFGEFRRLKIKGLKYEKLEIKELGFLGSGERGKDAEEPYGSLPAISRLLRRIAAHVLRRIADQLDEDDRDEDRTHDHDDD